MLTDQQQVDRLLQLAMSESHGAVLLVQRPGDLPHLTSLVPWVSDYQILCNKDGEHFDIWLHDHIVLSSLTDEQTNQWLASQTPEWVYDDSPPTEEQRATIAQWMSQAHEKQERDE
jgi:hypothetical protein